MALSWRDSIYQWLSKTTEDSQPRSARDHSPTVGSAKHPVTVPADLEALNAAQGSTPGKRTRGADQKDAREQHPPKKARNEYERRPRHKTREDRYDYKPSGSTSKPQSRQEKTKRLRRGRKQTMNDGFHASNVARERLTLRQNAHLGIFNKGKASSPMKVRDVTDLTFCETHFLSRKRPSIQTPPAAIGVNERRNQSKENSALYDFAAQMADRTASRPRMDLGHTLQKQDKADSIQHSLPFGKTSDLDACHGSDDAQRTTQQLQVQERTSKQESRSATPYSWSDSEPSKTPLDRAVERCLLDILHTGLSPEQNRDAENAGDSQRRYCNIQELKTLLEDRKAHWEPGNSDTVLEPFIRNCFPGETITTRTKYEKTAGPLPILSPEAVPSDGFSLPLNESIPDDIAYRSQRPHDCDRTVPINTRYQDQEHSQLHADTDMMEAEVEDEKAFFRKLDEAFHEIMNPRSKEIEPTGGRPDAHESACRASIHSKNGQCQLPLKAEPLRRESAASLLCDQLGFEISHLAPSPVGCHSAGELRTRSGRHCSSRNLPNMPLDKGRTDCSQNADDARLTRPRPPLSLSTTPVDPDFSRVARGFWRPNRLY